MGLLARIAAAMALAVPIVSIGSAVPCAAAPRGASARMLNRRSSVVRSHRLASRHAVVTPHPKAAPMPSRSVPRAEPKPVEPEKAALEFPEMRTPEEGALVTHGLLQVRGISMVIVDARTRLAVVDYDPGRLSMDLVLTACKDLGVPAREYRVENRFPKPIKLKGG